MPNTSDNKFTQLAVEYQHLTKNQAKELLRWRQLEKGRMSIDALALEIGYLSEAQVAEIMNRLREPARQAKSESVSKLIRTGKL